MRGSKLNDFEDNLMRWEEAVKEHDLVAENPATDDTKKITVIQSVPQEVSAQATAITESSPNYRDFRDKVVSFV